jgi:hypothetical protein
MIYQCEFRVSIIQKHKEITSGHSLLKDSEEKLAKPEYHNKYTLIRQDITIAKSQQY